MHTEVQDGSRAWLYHRPIFFYKTIKAGSQNILFYVVSRITFITELWKSFWHFIGLLGWTIDPAKDKTNRKKSKYNHAESGIRTDDIRVRTIYNRTGKQPRWWTLMNIVRQYWKVGNDHGHVNISVSTYHYSPSQDPPRRQFCNCWPILHTQRVRIIKFDLKCHMPNSYGQIAVAIKVEFKEFLSQLAICYFTFHKNINPTADLYFYFEKLWDLIILGS